jgi:DNA excision repair protein ERCC-4
MSRQPEDHGGPSALLPFHTSILQRLVDPATSDLLVLARGLGLRRIVCTLMKICDSPESLVLLVGATQEEESEIGEELGIMGCRRPGLRLVTFEMNTKARCVVSTASTSTELFDRKELYKSGGLISVTSQILAGDLLQSNMPTELITGLIVLHAEKSVEVKPNKTRFLT